MSALNIEKFPVWDFIQPRAAAQKIDWIQLGSEYDIAHVNRLWQRVMRFNLQTRDDIALRDAVRARLSAIENAIVEFIAEKSAEGFSLEEIDQLYAVELPVLFGYRVDGSRVRASYDAQIVKRAG